MLTVYWTSSLVSICSTEAETTTSTSVLYMEKQDMVDRYNVSYTQCSSGREREGGWVGISNPQLNSLSVPPVKVRERNDRLCGYEREAGIWISHDP